MKSEKWARSEEWNREQGWREAQLKTKGVFSYLQNVVLSAAEGANNQSSHRETIEQCNNKHSVTIE